MNRSPANEMTSIYRGSIILVLACLLAICGYAQNRVQPQARPEKSEENSRQSQAELDEISVRNALAQPAGKKASTSSSGKSRVEVKSNPLVDSSANSVILGVLDGMPTGGDYSASAESIHRLELAIKKDGDHLSVNAEGAKPSFCSSATYLVFVSALEALVDDRQITFSPGIAEKLLVSGQPDGVGVWGRWNANGPGTARLFAELQLGHNFTSIEEAKSGDFLKIFWNDQIGFKEAGHSVVYLGHGPNRDGLEVVRYWSSNKKGGYGRTEALRSKIKRMLFSRLEFPKQINAIGGGLAKDEYLASMLVRSGSPEEMKEKVGLTELPLSDPAPSVNNPTEDDSKRPSADGREKNEYQTAP